MVATETESEPPPQKHNRSKMGPKFEEADDFSDLFEVFVIKRYIDISPTFVEQLVQTRPRPLDADPISDETDYDLFVSADGRIAKCLADDSSASEVPYGETILISNRPLVEYQKAHSVAAKRKRKGTKHSESEGKKKWRTLSLAETGFNFSLFPRRLKPDDFGSELEDAESEDLIDYDSRFTNFQVDVSARPSKAYKKRKAYKQVKDKHLKSVKLNNGKTLYVKHNVYKKVRLEPRVLHFMPIRMPIQPPPEKPADEPSATKQDVCYSVILRPAALHKPVQRPNPQYALHSGNIPEELRNSTEMRLIRLLIQLQHREVTPNDYDLLMSLDTLVKPKTMDSKTLGRFRTERVSARNPGDVCAICMECYSVGQVKKFLPCKHAYHGECIDTWLTNSSVNCPVDGLPVSPR